MKRLVVFDTPYYVKLGDKDKQKQNKMLSGLKEHLALQRSLQRTKTSIKDIILCNHFEHFCTFTFADHRDDVEVCKARMQYWLKSQQKLHGSFEYLIVPEFHKDGKSLHFHALFRGYRGQLKPAVSSKTGKELFSHAGYQIFDIVSYRSGFGEAAKIEQSDESRSKVANYVTKYITKDMPQFFGKKRYWVSRSLVRPLRNSNVDPSVYYGDESAAVFPSDGYTTYVVNNKNNYW